MLKDPLYRLRALFRRGAMNAELEEELRDHVERETEKYIRAGMSAAEAKRKALIALGGVEQARQQTRESRGTRAVEHLLQDLHYSARSLGRSPGFTAVFILTLALGIGSCTAIFSLMVAVMIPPLPYGDPGRLVYVATPNHNLTSEVPPEVVLPDNADFADLKRDSRSFSDMTQFAQEQLKLSGTAISISGAKVDGDFFPTLGTKPELGRPINAEDNQPGSDGVAVISHSLGQRLFGEARAALGKPLSLAGRIYRIIGVMGPEFNFPHKTDLEDGDSHIDATDVWIPLALTAKERADRGFSSDNYVLGRLKPDVSANQAELELSAIMHRLGPQHFSTQFPVFTEGWYALVRPLKQTMEGSSRPMMLLLMGAVSFVLLIACGNAANLLLARSANRTHELGVRATLGAGRNRLMRQLLTEALLLGVSGGLAGVGLAWCFLRLLLTLDPGNIPRIQEATLNWRVLAFTVAMMLLTSILTGMVPAILSSRVNLIEFLKSGGHRGTVGSRSRLRGGLIVSEVAIVVVLLAGAGLLLRSYINLEQVPTGFSASTLSMRLSPPAAYTKPEQRRAFIRTLLGQIGSVGGIQAVGAVNSLPFGDNMGVTTFWVEGYANQKGQMTDGALVTPGYFSAMGTPLIEGRTFNENDESGSTKAAIINQAFARQYFAGRDPIGKLINNDQPTDPKKPFDTKNASTIVGVVADALYHDLEKPAPPQLIQPMTDLGDVYVVIRSVMPPKDAANAASAILHRMDGSIAFSKVHTMRELVSEATARRRFQTVLLTIFAGMAMALALVGFYGLLAYQVNQRGPEMGVRMALGATREHVMRLVLRQGLLLVSVGLAIGLVAAIAFTRLLISSLYGVSALDPVTFVAVPALLLAAAVAACLIPARRAANADPMTVLRCE